MVTTSLCVVCTSKTRLPQAQAFSSTHRLPLLEEKNPDYALQLCFDEARISLFDTRLNTSVHVDFVAGTLGHRQRFGGGRGQALARAIGLKQGITPVVLDATAGLARDAWVLATLGCRLILVEQSAVLATLIADGMERAHEDETSAQCLAHICELVQQEAVAYMHQLDDSQRPEVIYIDPMYPERKKSALVKKDMQILQRLLGKAQNDDDLLAAALKCARNRVVVKRPIHAGTLNPIKPSTSISSKKTRYDIYVIRKL